MLLFSLSLQTYGPGGLNPLLPGPQDNSKISLGIDAVQGTNPREQSYVVLAVRSPSDQAVDLSGWKVTAGSTTWKIPEGKFFVLRAAASFQTPSLLGVCFQHVWQPTWPVAPRLRGSAFIIRSCAAGQLLENFSLVCLPSDAQQQFWQGTGYSTLC